VTVGFPKGYTKPYWVYVCRIAGYSLSDSEDVTSLNSQ
jgi:hypothetical protein